MGTNRMMTEWLFDISEGLMSNLNSIERSLQVHSQHRARLHEAN